MYLDVAVTGSPTATPAGEETDPIQGVWTGPRDSNNAPRVLPPRPRQVDPHHPSFLEQIKAQESAIGGFQIWPAHAATQLELG